MAAYYSAHGHGVMTEHEFIQIPFNHMQFPIHPFFWHNAFMYYIADQNYQMHESIFFPPKILILDTGSMSRFALWWLKINIGLFSSALQFSKLYCNSVHSVYYIDRSCHSLIAKQQLCTVAFFSLVKVKACQMECKRKLYKYIFQRILTKKRKMSRLNFPLNVNMRTILRNGIFLPQLILACLLF